MIRIAQRLIIQMLTEAGEADPCECCGILLGQGSRRGETITAITPAANIHPTPQTHFEIDPAALILAHKAARQGGEQVAGYYHSHPNGRAEPSPTDRAMAAGNGAIWAIVANGTVGFWRDGEGDFATLPYTSF